MMKPVATHQASEHGIFPFPEGKTSGWKAVLSFTLCMVASLVLYQLVFSLVRKPYSIGIYPAMIEAKLANWRAKPAPRLLVVAGSNARISHQAQVFEEVLGIPATNGGLTADLSLEFLLHIYEPELERGDILYLPLEYDPLATRTSRTKSERLYLAAYNREVLARFAWKDRLESLFCFELGDLFAEPLEILAARSGKSVNRRSQMNKWGDQIGYTEESAEPYRQGIMESKPGPLPIGADISKRPSSVRLLESFVERCKAKGIVVIGGLPTTFDDREVSSELISEIEKIYRSRGQYFIQLPNQSQYPRDQFYDSPYHLNESAAETHTRLLAEMIKPFIRPR